MLSMQRSLHNKQVYIIDPTESLFFGSGHDINLIGSFQNALKRVSNLAGSF